MMLKPGDTFGDYRVLKLLGKGGMGSVFLLENAEGGRVAAKILDPVMAGDHESRRRFVREAQFALGVKHPNLIETYDVGEDPETGLCYILMEYVSGGSLADYLKEHGALSVEDAVAVVQAMASVLEQAREKGIVHRDIKPSNIMFDAEGTPKLADLGIARGGPAGTETTTVTQTGMMIGTPAYMAPEQMLDAHHVDTRADIYSLGVVFFEMLTGERPNKDDTIVQLMAKAVKGEPLPDVRTLRPEVSASLAQLLAMMVAPNKNGRISTPRQITSALDIIERGGTFAAKPGTAAARRTRRKPFPWRSLIPFGLLAGLAAAFVALAPKREPAEEPQVAPIVKTEVRTIVQTNVVERIVEKKVEVKGHDAPEVKIAEERAKLPKVSKSDFRAKLVGVAVVDADNRSLWNLNADFLPPETHVEIPFGKAALFKVEYDLPEGYQARVWARDEWPSDLQDKAEFFSSNPSGFHRGKGVTTGFLALNAHGKDCTLKSLAIRTSSEPEIDGETGIWKIGSFPVDIVFKEKVAETLEDSPDRRSSTPPGWLDDLESAKERARTETKLILAAFEGSDWCGWCKKMERDVYTQPEFMPTVLPRFVPVYIDRPRDRTLLREAVRERNPALHGEYGIRGVPCVVILDAEGRELGRVGGYKQNVGALMEKINAIPGAAEPLPILSEKGHVADAMSVSDDSATKAVQKTLNVLFPGWKTSENAKRGAEHMEGYVRNHLGRGDCVCTHPQSLDQPEVVLRRDLVVPKNDPVLRFSVAAFDPLSEFRVQAKANGRLVFEEDVAGGKWRDVCVDLSQWAGKQAKIELVHRAIGWNWEWAFWWRMEVGEWDGRESRLAKLVPAVKLADRSRYADPDPTKAVRKAFKALFPGWTVSENGGGAEYVGYYEEFKHRHNLVMTHPPRENVPVVLTRAVKVPKNGATLHMEVASHDHGDFELEVHVRGKVVRRELITPERGFADIDVDLSEHAGKSVKVEIWQVPNNWQWEMAFWSKIEVK